MRKPRRPRAGVTGTATDPVARRAEERAERLTTLSRLTRSIASATDSDAAFRAIAEAATTLLEAKTAYVWVDAGGETLREGGSFWAGPEPDGRIVRAEPVPRNASIAGADPAPARGPRGGRDQQRAPVRRQRRPAARGRSPRGAGRPFSRKQMLQMGMLDLNGVVSGLAPVLKPCSARRSTSSPCSIPPWAA